MAGTEGATCPFFSPDGRFIGFFADHKLKKVPATGGSVLTICDAADGRGASWGAGDVIVFSPGPFSPLFRVAAAGGASTKVTELPQKSGSTHRLPYFLPDGRHLLFFAGGSKTIDTENTIAVLDLETRKVTIARAREQRGPVRGARIPPLLSRRQSHGAAVRRARAEVERRSGPDRGEGPVQRVPVLGVVRHVPVRPVRVSIERPAAEEDADLVRPRREESRQDRRAGDPDAAGSPRDLPGRDAGGGDHPVRGRRAVLRVDLRSRPRRRQPADARVGHRILVRSGVVARREADCLRNHGRRSDRAGGRRILGAEDHRDADAQPDRQQLVRRRQDHRVSSAESQDRFARHLDRPGRRERPAAAVPGDADGRAGRPLFSERAVDVLHERRIGPA